MRTLMLVRPVETQSADHFQANVSHSLPEDSLTYYLSH
jgi:hypothetical protein